MKLSACYIAKNEEKNIGASIASLGNQVEEIIVVDTGSTDNTVAVAERLGAKVYHYKWQDDFAAARNFALSKATGDWLILLDADESFTQATRGNIIRAVAEAGGADGLLVQLVNYDKDKQEIMDYFYQLRLVKNQPGIHYEGAIHEELAWPKGRKVNIKRLPPELLEIYHTGYSTSISRQKLERNLKLLQNEIARGRSELELSRYLCECYLGLEDMEKCLHYGWMYINQGRQPVTFAARCHRILLAYYAEHHDVDSVEQRYRLAKLATEQFPEVPDFWAEYGESLAQQKKYGEAAAAMDKASQLLQDYQGMEPSMLKEKNLGQIVADRGRKFRRLAQADDAYASGSRALQEGKLSQAAELFFQGIQEYKYHQGLLQGLYQCLAGNDLVDIVQLLNSIYDSRKDGIFIAETLNGLADMRLVAYYAKHGQAHSKKSN